MEPNKIAPDPSNNGSLPDGDNTNTISSTNSEFTITSASSQASTNVTPPESDSDRSVSQQPLDVTPTPAEPKVLPNTNQPVSAGFQPQSNPVLGVPVVGQTGLPQPVYGANQALSATNNKSKFSKKKLLLGALLALFMVGGGTGYVLAFYIPNKPANVYQTGLSRSGENLTKLVDKFTETDRLQKLENSEITATAEAKGAGYTYNGTFGVKLSKTKADGSLDIHIKSGSTPEETLVIKFLSDLPENKKYPNFYFQVTGLKGLGLDVLSPEIAAYEGKWIAVESDYLESIYSGENAPKNKENVTSAELANLIKTISKTSNEYLFTSDNNKAVLENKAFIGKETVDGINAYHYQVGINKAHAKDYCQTLSERIISEPVYKKLLNLDDQGVADQKKDIAAECDKAIKEIKDDTTLDMWIDAKYKLIHKIRMYDEKDKGIYTDIGQTYTGGDNVSFFVAYHKEANKTDAKFTVDVDMKAYTSKGTFTWNQKQPEEMDLKVTFEAKPYTGEVKADKPAGAISIQELMNKLGFGSPSSNPSTSNNPSSSSNVQTKAKDTERKTDINALFGQVEAYYAQYGYYPSFDNLNSATWRTKYMKGLDSEALKDPDGTLYTLTTTATSKQYGYAATQCTNAQCQAYTLTAVLSDGTKYSKQNLN